MKLFCALPLAVVSLLTSHAYAGGIYSDVPESPVTSEKYIFYMHGSVEESEGATGKYEAAVEAIARSSAIVISEVRGDTDPKAYAEKLKKQVDALTGKGVPPENITISGFSKGSIITLASARAIDNPAINYVLLAGCSAYLNNKYGVDPSGVVGRILSVYDSGDEKFGSCSGVIQSSGDLKFKEIKLKSGKGHKVFRIPKEKFIKQWRNPLVDWAGA